MRPLIRILVQINPKAQIADLRSVDPQIAFTGIDFKVALYLIALCQQDIETA